MLSYSLIGIGLVLVTVVIHATGTTFWLYILAHRLEPSAVFNVRRPLLALISSVLLLLVLHVVEIAVWAYTYLQVLPPGQLGSFEEAMYFSFVTFTTLGYGDITLAEGFRIMSGIEALNGIILGGWTTALLFAVVQRTFGKAIRIEAGEIPARGEMGPDRD